MFYAEEGLRQALNDEASQNGALSIQIKAVLQVLEKEFFHEKQQLAEMLGKGEIVFDKLWVLFPPRCLVTTLDAFGEPSVHRLERHHVSSPEGRRVAMEIEICCVDTDGQGYGWTTATCLKIPEFWGHAKISTLPVFPLNFHPDKDLYDKLAANGLVRLELSGAGLYEYSGIALREEDDGVERDNMTKFQVRIPQFIRLVLLLTIDAYQVPWESAFGPSIVTTPPAFRKSGNQNSQSHISGRYDRR